MIIHPNDSCSLSHGVNCILEPNKKQFKQLVVDYSALEYNTILEVVSQRQHGKDMISRGVLVSCSEAMVLCWRKNVFAANSRVCPLLTVMLLVEVTMVTAIMN